MDRQLTTQLRTLVIEGYKRRMSVVETILMMAFLVPLLLAISWVHEELRMVEPKTRFGFGIASFAGAAITFFVIMKLLPEPTKIEVDLPLQTLLMGGVSIFAGGLVLSIALISSAAWQAFKRWKFHRSNVR
ncbi:hypothetical protein [Altererythrobacter sp.]|uniref:hypothetical protein n=1 Tax=Altererythrobacter sp. TaxID=1872480 RepID=UPI003CFCC51A